MNETYNVYLVDPKIGYSGCALVAAVNAKQANNIIRKFIQTDSNNMRSSSGYCFVNEAEKVSNVFAAKNGILHYGIYPKIR